MPRSGEQLSLALRNNKCKCGDHADLLPYICIEDGENVTSHCSGTGNKVIDCRHPDLRECINEIDGLDLNEVNAVKVVTPEELPNFIPVICNRLFKLPSELMPYEIVGVSLADFLGVSVRRINGSLVVSKPKIRSELLRLPIFENKKVILFSTGQDVVIERLWGEIKELNYFEILRKVGFTAVTAINYSLFLNECPIGHSINMKRSLKTFNWTQRAGKIGIPHIYWLNDCHLDRWLNWLDINPLVRLVTINCRLFKKVDFPLVIKGFKRLTEETDGKLHLLVEGASMKLLECLRSFSANIHVAIKYPTVYAANYIRLDYMNNHLVRNMVKTSTPKDLISRNLKSYQTYLEQKFY